MKIKFTPSGWIWREKSHGKSKEQSQQDVVPMQQEVVQKAGGHLSKKACFFIDLLLLLLGSQGLFIGFFFAFDFPVYLWIIYSVSTVFPFLVTCYYWLPISAKYRKYILRGMLGVAVLFVLTNVSFLKKGGMDCVTGIVTSFNLRYDSQIVTGEWKLTQGSLTLFFILLVLIITLILSFFTMVQADLTPVFLVEFPIITLILFVGKRINGGALLMILLHFTGVMAEAYLGEQKESILSSKTGQPKKNQSFFSSVQKKSAMAAGTLLLLSAVVSLYVIMPLLPDKNPVIQRWGSKLQGSVIGIAVEYLPVLTGGKWKLKVQTPGGGVEDGVLGETAGYSLTNMDDLLVTSTIEPKETIYLRGYVGNIYENNRWMPPSAEKFDDAVLYWHLEGNPRVYIQNLPFLREMYLQNQSGQDSAVGIMSVENINAGDKYTFLPYCSYINDYYQVSHGDGSIKSQRKAKDEFSYFPLRMYIETMKEHSEGQEENVLDRVQEEYSAYVTENYLDVPEGLEALEEEYTRENISRKDSLEKKIRFVTTYLVNNYDYNIQVSKLPKGKDFITYFLSESKEGYSAHFASAAVVMFRMLGVPARYVTGYAVPENVFSQDASGTYTALLQGDNAHAWAEIYMSGIGWVPVETTPGNLGVLEYVYGEENADSDGEKAKQETEQENGQSQEMTEEEKEAKQQERRHYAKIRWYLGGVLFLLAVVVLIILTARWIKSEIRKRGYDKSQEMNERIVALFCMICITLRKAGMPQEVSSTSPEFKVWLQKVIPDITPKTVDTVVNMALAAAYGEKQMTKKELAYIRSIYKQCSRQRKKKIK